MTNVFEQFIHVTIGNKIIELKKQCENGLNVQYIPRTPEDMVALNDMHPNTQDILPQYGMVAKLTDILTDLVKTNEGITPLNGSYAIFATYKPRDGFN